jgi:hypothetical protein
MNIKKYGAMDEELYVQDRIKCREIVKEILDFGVNQRQLLQIAYLLSLELESHDDMAKISNCISEVVEKNDDLTNNVIV